MGNACHPERSEGSLKKVSSSWISFALLRMTWIGTPFSLSLHYPNNYSMPISETSIRSDLFHETVEDGLGKKRLTLIAMEGK